MPRRAAFLLLALALPSTALAAAPSTLFAGRALLIATSSPANSYALGGSVAVSGAVAGDLTALGGSVMVAAPVKQDALLVGGSVETQAPIGGDLRAAAATVSLDAPVAGDFAAIAGSVTARGRVHGSVLLLAGSTNLEGGADGAVTIYGDTVNLAGDYAGDVEVVARGRVTLLPGTRIQGALSYESPEAAVIPSDATVGSVSRSGASSGASASGTLALVGVGVFLFARIFGALILAGLLAGLFPQLAEAVTVRAYESRPRGLFLTALLGFAALVATPILLVILSLTFIGLGLALLLFIGYGLLALLSFTYAGIMLGGAAARRVSRRTDVYWRDGALGMLALSLLWLVPFLGQLMVALLVFFSAGALLTLFFHFAFPHDADAA